MGEEERRMKRSEEIVYLGTHTVRGRAAEEGRENIGSSERDPDHGTKHSHNIELFLDKIGCQTCVQSP